MKQVMSLGGGKESHLFFMPPPFNSDDKTTVFAGHVSLNHPWSSSVSPSSLPQAALL